MKMKNLITSILLVGWTILNLSLSATGAQKELSPAELKSLEGIYQSLHSHPELSHYEEQTANFISSQLRSYGYTVTENFGRYEPGDWKAHGVVAIMKNQSGPTVLMRTDLDALPVEEKTGLPYASKVKMQNDAGAEVPVMHACGHDLHMTIFLGTARRLAQMKDQWHGTLMLIGQPAEETGEGANAMLAGGLYTKFSTPDYLIALHDTPVLEAGSIGYCPGYAMASATSVDLLVRGIGGHGSKPESTKDPIVIAAQILLALQTIVSREKSPLAPGVVTVGSIHGGTKHNIIPDDVRMQLTIRVYEDTLRQQILAAIERIARFTALAAGVPEDRLPVMTVIEKEVLPSTYNDPVLTSQLGAALEKVMGKEKVAQMPPVMGSEDYGLYSLPGHKIPSCLLWLGTTDPEKLAQSQKSQVPLPYLHSALFAPLPGPSIQGGVQAMTTAVLSLMAK
jgi:amidohydrolase